MKRALLLLLCSLALVSAADGVMFRLEFKPFYIELDLGDTPAEKRKVAERYARWVSETGNYFLAVFDLKKTCFEDYASHYNSAKDPWEPLVRVRLFRKFDDFLKDFQKRYDSKSIPAAFFGINKAKDEYGNVDGRWLREIAAATEGHTEAETLRHLYHEMGHLFMRTFVVWNVEVPSWIEEGTAQLFQYRPGNGTKPEEERDQRQGWLVEMCNEGSVIPWPEFTSVRNIDNLDFTWKDQLRSTIQYAQAWSVMEFMIANPERRKAFKTLLNSFKSGGEQATREARQRGLDRDAYFEYLGKYLYDHQLALFKKAYGADLLTVEALWKGWIQKNYDKEVVKKPILRYYRGDWWAGPRLNSARTPADRDKALAAAEAIFNECVKVTPNLPEGYVGLGRVFLSRDDLKAAGESFAKANSLGTENFEALLYGGIALIRSGKAADAIPSLTKGVLQRPTHAQVNFYLGQAMALSDADLTQTLTYLTRARDLQKELLDQCATLEGAAQYRANKPNEAAISFLRASNVDKNNPVLPLALALSKAASSDIEDALAVLEQATKEGNPFADDLAKIIKSGKSLPKLIFSRRGQLLVEGLTVIREEEPVEAEKPKEKAKETAPADVFGDPDAPKK